MIGKAPPTSGAAPSAMRAAPVLSGVIDGSLCEIPSGKSPTASPAASAACTASNIVALRASLLGSSLAR